MVAALSVPVNCMYVNKAATWPWRYTEQSSRGEDIIKVVDLEPVGRRNESDLNGFAHHYLPNGKAGIYMLKLQSIPAVVIAR